MHVSLIALTLPAVLALSLLTVPAVEADASAQSAAATATETLAERQQRTALELEAENLLVKLHYQPLEVELEPCINGAVSPNGLFASAEMQQVVERLATGDLNEHLDNSAYYRAFNDGRVVLTD